MNYEACSFACCSFNGRYLFKFGGIGDQNTITHFIVKKIILLRKCTIRRLVNGQYSIHRLNLSKAKTSCPCRQAPPFRSQANKLWSWVDTIRITQATSKLTSSKSTKIIQLWSRTSTFTHCLSLKDSGITFQSFTKSTSLSSKTSPTTMMNAQKTKGEF